jgi:hypothetical protein
MSSAPPPVAAVAFGLCHGRLFDLTMLRGRRQPRLAAGTSAGMQLALHINRNGDKQ